MNMGAPAPRGGGASNRKQTINPTNILIRAENPRCGRSAEDGSSRVQLPSGRTPRPFAVRVPRGLHSTPPNVRAGPTPTVAGCSRAAPERPLPKGSHLAARNPSAPPIRPDPTTLRPRLDSPACFAIATPSPAPRPPSALRSRRLTTFQVQDAGSTPRARHRAVDARAGMGWLVGHRWAPQRQDSSGLGFGMLRTSLPLVLSVDCVCGRTSRYILNIGKYRFLYFPNRTLIAFIKGPLLNPLSSNEACLRQDFQVFTCSWMADAKFFGNQTAADSVPDKVPGDLRRKVPPRVLQPEQYTEPVLIGQRPKHAICFHFLSKPIWYLTLS